ncbi:MAG TPA: dTDP-4-dehydrorhamnose 3,5-epimerase [Nitrospira sp.]|nr:dTDP-4-dehydrorhamnose 3,5-epimerase [Nitrospira sp.]
MRVTKLVIPDLVLFEPKIFLDERGMFYESFRQQLFEEATDQQAVFVQDNQTSSVRGVLRGLHYQLPPKAQGKLVRVLAGEIYDVAVDIRKHSPTFGHWIGERLSAENKRQLWVPSGFAHGFVVLSEQADVLYKTTEYYAPELERCIRWDDPDLAITWPIEGEPILSAKDQQGHMFAAASLFP